MHKKVVSVRDGRLGSDTATAKVYLAHNDRHIRRKTIRLTSDEKILVDLPEPTFLNSGDVLVLEDGSTVQIEAAPEELYRVSGRDGVHLLQLAWHIGNRHLPAEITVDHILILRDHVIRSMLEGLGAQVVEFTGPFTPTRGAYDFGAGGRSHSHGHEPGHAHVHHRHD